VQRGDTLSKIAKQHYGNAMKYPVIFEANKPMLKHPDKIYPGQVPAACHGLNGRQHLQEIEIVHRLGLMMVAVGNLVPGHHHDIGNPQGLGRQQVALQRQAVAVPAAHLHHRFQSLALQEERPPQRTQPHHGVVHLRDHKGVHHALDAGGCRHHVGYIRAFGRLHLRQNGKFAGTQFLFKWHRGPSLRLLG